MSELDQPTLLDVRLAIAQDRLRVLRLIQQLFVIVRDTDTKACLLSLAEAVQEGNEKL